MIHFIRLIRIQNLLVIALVQCFLRWFVMLPILERNGFSLQLRNIDFILLVFSTILLAAAGYIINDYFDRKTDMINKPKKVIILRFISNRFAIATHSILNLIAVIIGFYLSYRIHSWKLIIIYLIIPLILWSYSVYFKRKFMIGNLIVTIFTSFIPLMVILFEIPMLRHNYQQSILNLNEQLDHIFSWITAYSIFTFIMTWIYIFTKEIEDVEGDTISGVKSIVLIYGRKFTNLVISLLSIFIISVSFYIIYSRINSTINYIYFSLLVLIPFILLNFLLFSNNKRLSHYPLFLVKFIMLAGVFYTIIANYIINQ